MNLPGKQERTKYFILGTAVLITFIIPMAQYYFRRFDDNKLVSWDWMFMVADPVIVSLALLTGLVLASFALKFSLPVRMRSFFLFFACFTGAALLWGAPEVNVDTSRYFSQAKYLELHGARSFFSEWGRDIPIWLDLPAIPFFDGMVFRIFGESRIFVQVFTAVLFAMTAVLTSWIGKALWDEDTGFHAGLLLLGMPYLITQTPLMLVDVPTMFFVTLSIYLFHDAVKTPERWRIAAAVIAVFVTFFCKYSALLMISILPVIAIVTFFSSTVTLRRSIIQRSLLVFLPSTLFIGAAGALKFDVIAGQIKLFMNFQLADMGRWGESFVSTFLFQISPIITIAAVASLFIAARKRDINYLVAAWLPFLIVLLQIKRIRYLFPVFPMLALMASYGLNALRDRMNRKVTIACVVVTSLVTCFFVYLPYLNSWSAVNLQQAGEFLNTLDGIDTVEVFTLPQRRYPINPAVAVPLLDLFTRKKIVYRYVQGSSTPDEDVQQSRFRFSWEYRNPDYYTADADDAMGKKAVALIFRPRQDSVPPEVAAALEGLHHSASFTSFNSLFHYQTLVRIYW